MINRNIDRIEKLKDPLDYDGYSKQCEENGVQVLDYDRFCLGIVTYIKAKKVYPDMPIQEAYIKIFDDIAKQQKIEDAPATVLPPSKKKKKSDCCPDKNKAPNLAQKGLNFAKALTEHIITGKKHVAPDEYMNRLLICKSCPERAEGFVCSKCGCYMGIKASWAEQKCELKKW